ncbi:hypothetical protein GA0074692_6231 [Micromonospora pallida]|uniref:Uncharacterized protein n=1 Tax=Micromonospora pallida TaxID=145854 RepID=A0A1C6THL6_9ACTN|nr:hypothetical protein [Micromonospora pallida]SCL41270.1 hypothetical protein GA0074692_6231 [Micromonospora pallida]
MTIDSDPLPTTLSWAARLLWGEAVALGLVAVWLAYENLTADAFDLASAVLITVFAAGGALALWALGTALARRRAGARAPAIVLQLMLLPVGWYMIQGGLGWLGVPLMVLGVGVCALLLAPASTRALGLPH